MDPAIISALSAVMGSLVGGSASITTSWIAQKTANKRELIGTEIQKRESLYAEFIGECSKLAIDALDHTLEHPNKLFQVYALQNRIRLTSSEAVVDAATQTLEQIIKQYFGPNDQLEAFREHKLSVTEDSLKHYDLLKPFSEACRKELKALKHRL